MRLNNGTLHVTQKYENDLRNIHSVPILIQLGLISKPHEIEIYICIYKSISHSRAYRMAIFYMDDLVRVFRDSFPVFGCNDFPPKKKTEKKNNQKDDPHDDMMARRRVTLIKFASNIARL